jgi:peptide/nickel transport system permease protein
MISAISTGDLPVVQAVTLVFVLFAVSMSLLADIGYGLVNPKIRVL